MTPEETVERPDDAGEWDEAWDEKDGKTPEEKIAALVEHVKAEFPKGCDGAKCSKCPLNGYKDGFERAICDVLNGAY